MLEYMVTRDSRELEILNLTRCPRIVFFFFFFENMNVLFSAHTLSLV